jgi:hypothetical protein
MVAIVLQCNILAAIMASIALATIKSYEYVPEPDPQEIYMRTWPSWAIAAHQHGWISPVEQPPLDMPKSIADTSDTLPLTPSGHPLDTLLTPRDYLPLIPPFDAKNPKHRQAAADAIATRIARGYGKQQTVLEVFGLKNKDGKPESAYQHGVRLFNETESTLNRQQLKTLLEDHSDD